MPNDAQALRGMLGLCQRSGKLQSGTDTVIRSIRSGACRLALIDGGATANTVKKITDPHILPCAVSAAPARHAGGSLRQGRPHGRRRAGRGVRRAADANERR